jgi:hypothetical protein
LAGRRPDAALSFLRYHARDMATKHKVDVLKWARLGAASRLRELDEERKALLKAFPGLTSGSGPARREVTAKAVGAGSGSASAPIARKRRKMSAAGRKRISDAQKKRWAAQKARGG